MLARLPALCALSFASCVGAPPAERIANAPIGPPPDEPVARRAAEWVVRENLDDVSELAFEWPGEIRRAYYAATMQNRRYGWSLPVQVTGRTLTQGVHEGGIWQVYFRDSCVVAYGRPPDPRYGTYEVHEIYGSPPLSSFAGGACPPWPEWPAPQW